MTKRNSKFLILHICITLIFIFLFNIIEKTNKKLNFITNKNKINKLELKKFNYIV